jgi:hypothetical protein
LIAAFAAEFAVARIYLIASAALNIPHRNLLLKGLSMSVLIALPARSSLPARFTLSALLLVLKVLYDSAGKFLPNPHAASHADTFK